MNRKWSRWKRACIFSHCSPEVKRHNLAAIRFKLRKRDAYLKIKRLLDGARNGGNDAVTKTAPAETGSRHGRRWALEIKKMPPEFGFFMFCCKTNPRWYTRKPCAILLSSRFRLACLKRNEGWGNDGRGRGRAWAWAMGGGIESMRNHLMIM